MINLTPAIQVDGYRYYGRWGGDPKGRKEDRTRCIASVASDTRAPMFSQCRRRRGHGPDGFWCRQHDPSARSAKETADRIARETAKQTDDAIERDARRLARRLGVRGSARWVSGRHEMRYVRELCIPFADVEKLIARLKEMKP